MTEQHPQPQSKAREFFLYLFGAVALYASAISLLNLLFDVINTRFPDALDYGFDPFSSSMRMAIATLVILFPLYLIIMHILNADLIKDPEKRNLGIRKWLSYLTLFLAAVAMATDLVVLINTFLGGEITARFILKVLAVLVVAAGVFGYYFFDLKNIWQEKRKQARIVSISASLFVFLSIVLAFMVVGSPTTQRLMRIDNQKVSDLQSIQWQVINFWQQKGTFPQTLADLNDPISGFAVPLDPETNLGKSYTYDTTGKTTFDLCANFNLPTPTGGTPITSPMTSPAVGTVSTNTMYAPGRGDNWQHDKDVVCFKRIIDPQLYPVIKK